ncbi:MAG: hypothetical protein MJ132_06295 [Clostridia bacterium]|nr:hypothetical protein [Clostridia bacterium]
MCIAIYSLKGNPVPSDEILKTCFRNNEDGAGFAFNTDNGQVRIEKGFMKFDDFLKAFHKFDKRFDFKNRGVLIHFRITTHGGTNKSCCHPFPISENEKALKKTSLQSSYAAIHNGIIRLTSDTADKRKGMSDTMVFVEQYLSKIATNKGWFNNAQNFKLIYDLIDSKMAVLNGKGEIHATEGFAKGEDGNYYSNTSYMDYYGFGLGCYGYDLFDDDAYGYYDEMALTQLKRGESVFYDDGTTEDYQEIYHSDYPVLINDAGEIFSCYDCRPVGNRVDMDRLIYLGSGYFVKNSSPLSLVEFREDVVAYSVE